MSVAILTANLGNFDKPKPPVIQTVESVFHMWTDENFPPITGLTPRLQYRIPKTHGWQMFPDHDIYIWLDAALSLQRPDCLEWYLDQLGDNDFAIYKHPNRHNIRQEVQHIEEKLEQDHWYIKPRYENGLHRENLDQILATGYKDNALYHSGAFVYRNTGKVQEMLKEWWYQGTRYFSCDQIPLPYLLHKYQIKVKVLEEPIYKTGYISMVSRHK